MGRIALSAGSNELPMGFTARLWAACLPARWHVMILRDGLDCGALSERTKDECEAFVAGFLQAQALERPLRTVRIGPRVHELKTVPDAFEAVLNGRKTFEFRLNDRDFQVGDTLFLREWSETDGYTGRRAVFGVTYVAKDRFGIPPGYCVMSISAIR